MLYLRYARVSLRGQFSRPANVALMALSQTLVALGSLAVPLALFTRFRTLAGYSRTEVLLCFGIAHASISAVELLARGFDSFSVILSQGEFDRILARPRGTVLQVLCARLDLARLGRLVVGLLCLAYALADLWPGLSASGALVLGLRLLTLLLMFLGSAAIFMGVFVLGAAFCFLSTDSLELVNILSDGGRELSQYPLAIYRKGFRRFFTLVVPFGCVNYLPLEFVLGRPGSGPWAAFLPLAGLLFLGLTLLVWRAGVRRYVSTGS